MKQNEWNPGTLLETSGGFWKTCALHAAVKLDIFTVIGEERLSSGAVAEKTETDPRAAAMLLNAMTAMNLLEKSTGLYANTTAARTFLSKTSPGYIGHIIKHHHHLVESWGKLDESVKTGRSVQSDFTDRSEEERESFLMGMFNLATNLAPKIVPEIDLSGSKSFLDLGGGPGTYAINFCLKNPDLKAVVFDLPTTRPFAEKTISRFGMSDRISFQGGSFPDDPIEGSFDVAWLSHILHGEGPEDCRKIIQKAVSALEPGGMIMIHEFILNDEKIGPLFPALFSLNMLLNTSSGQAYSEKELCDMLKDEGVKNIGRIFIESPNDSGIIFGYV